MTKVVVDMSMSLDGFVAGPDDGKTFPLGRHGGMHVFDWYTSGPRRPGDLDILHPEPGVNREVVDAMFVESGAFIFGRRTYELTNGWGGHHPVKARRFLSSRTNRRSIIRVGHRISLSSLRARLLAG